MKNVFPYVIHLNKCKTRFQTVKIFQSIVRSKVASSCLKICRFAPKNTLEYFDGMKTCLALV
jgi:hypothetical protein